MAETSGVLRQLHCEALMGLLIQGGPRTRVELATESGLSKQAVSEIVRQLVEEGWVRECGQVSGRAGRSPVNYEFVTGARHVIGVDLGATTLELALADLSGHVLAQRSERPDERGGRHLVDRIERIARELADEAGVAWETVHSAAIGAPGIADPSTGIIYASNNLPWLADLPLGQELETRLGVPVSLDNEVNRSALGEQWQGHGRELADFVMMNIGTGVGVGVVLDGAVRRGSRGWAGEVAFLPLGTDPFDRRNQAVGAFETAVGAAALLRSYADGGGVARGVVEVFDAFSAGDDRAVAAVDEHARVIALGISAIAAVADPSVVVLGGGVGSRTELLEPVRRWLALLMREPVRVEVSALGNGVALIGAVAAALVSAHHDLFGLSPTASSLPVPRPIPDAVA